MIINDKGQTVWFKSTPGKIPADFRVQQLGGKPVLTWWEGQLFVGDGDGVGQVYDPNYNRVATVTAGNGYSFDLHEFTLTPQNTAIVLSYERYKRDLRPWGGPRDARDRRQHRPGDRPAHRRRAVRVALVRQRLAEGVQRPAAHRRPASSGSTSTSTRPRSRRTATS